MEIPISKSEKPVLFIVGNSRSGTTMLMRIFNQHPEVNTINESRFFEQYWKPTDANEKIDHEKAVQLMLQLVSRQRDGFFAKVNKAYLAESELAIASQIPGNCTRTDVFKLFLGLEQGRYDKSITCEKTPQHIFYIREIFEAFPNARIINMVRDPRAVLASQKNKWKRRALGSSFMPLKESLRLRINYHPITMCQLWNAAVGAIDAFKDHPQVCSIRYEDLLLNPRETIEALCAFCTIDFMPEMLEIEVASSSHGMDTEGETGFKKHGLDSWKRHLSAHEIAMVQKWCGPQMQYWNYQPIVLESSGLSYLLSIISYPFKLALALMVNLWRLRSLGQAIRRRVTKQKVQYG